jgi:hypothetical protein
MDVRKIVSEAGQLGTLNDKGLPNEVLARGRFLFGPEIRDDLEKLHRLTVCQETGDTNAVTKIDAHFKQMIPKFEPIPAHATKDAFASVRGPHFSTRIAVGELEVAAEGASGGGEVAGRG